MEFLFHAIKNRQLVMNCPNCKGVAFQASGLGCGLLHCNSCYTHTAQVEWVAEIKRCGDDDPHVHLRVVRSDNGFVVQVNTDRRSADQESVRFGGGRSGGRSCSTKEALRVIASAENSERIPCIQFEGQGGKLKIFGGRGDDDMWMKTEDLKRNLFHGAEVLFLFQDRAVPGIQSIVQALLKDMESRPIF